MLERVPLRVHQDLILTEQMFIEPKTDAGEVLLLPAKTIYEQTDGSTVTSAERRVMFSPELPCEVGETRSHWRILRDVAATAYPNRATEFACASAPAIREEIARVVAGYHGTQYLQHVGDAFQAGGPRLFHDRQFATSDGKAHFQLAPLAQASSSPQRNATNRSAALAADSCAGVKPNALTLRHDAESPLPRRLRLNTIVEMRWNCEAASGNEIISTLRAACRISF